MKTKWTVALLLAYNLFNAQYGNFGINTDEPEEKLHINGSLKADQIDFDTKLEKLTSTEPYTFLIKESATSNKITTYDSFFDTGRFPLNFIQFEINTDNSDRDWVNEYDTDINAEKYIVVISSFGFNLPVGNSADRTVTPIPQIYAYKKASTNTWALKADYDSFRPDSGNGKWLLNLLVFDKAYATAYAEKTINMNNATTGIASTALIQ